MADTSSPSILRPRASRWQKAATPPAGLLLDLLIQATRLLEVHPDLMKDRSVESSLRRLASAARESRKDEASTGRKEMP
jgi:hypothetical protein